MEKYIQIRLVKKAKNGDTKAFIQLCESYQTVLYNSAYKLLKNDEDVADCLQETEILAWIKIDSIRNESTFNSWIFRIMINIAKAILRKRVEIVQFTESDQSTETKYQSDSELEVAFEQLSEKYKIPIILYYYAGFNISEIASQLNMPKNTVKTRLARGREKLKIILEG